MIALSPVVYAEVALLVPVAYTLESVRSLSLPVKVSVVVSLDVVVSVLVNPIVSGVAHAEFAPPQ